MLHKSTLLPLTAGALFLLVMAGILAYSSAHPPEAYTRVIEAHQTHLEELARNPLLRTTAAQATIVNQSLTQPEVERLDRQWRDADGVHEAAQALQENETAYILAAFQEQHPIFIEIFLTDAHGLNIAQTNKTSDYYQADEEWWQRSFNNGSGHLYMGATEYDDSARSWSIPLYAPIYHDDGQVVGIIKAVLDTEQIR